MDTWTAADVEELIAESAPMFPRHAVSMHDFTRIAIDHLIRTCEILRGMPPAETVRLYPGRIVAILFYQPSTRTRLNFQSAAQRMGAGVTGFSDPSTTRAGDFYRETTSDVVAFTSAISDLVVLRHPESGAARRAAAKSQVPVINAGDGYNEHPTQALGDIYTMQRILGTLDGKCIGLVGDLGIRSLRALLIGLRHFHIGQYVFLPPPGMTIPDEVRTLLTKTERPWIVVGSVEEMLDKADLIETIGTNHPDHSRNKDLDSIQSPTPVTHRLTRRLIEGADRPVAVLHPGPRTDEIDVDVDDTKAARYFDQAVNGMWMRMALMSHLLYRSP